MSEVHGTYRDGKVELKSGVDWPNGMLVTVHPLPLAQRNESADEWQDSWGIDDDWPDTPENRAEILRRMDAVEPLEMTDMGLAPWSG